MPTPFIGEIKIISWNFPPKGWAFCNGQLLPINQNQALFSILGTTYGGDGRTTFGLPNMQGRMPVHVGQGIVLGERGGETSHTLNISELAAHVHQLSAIAATADTTTPGNVPSSSLMPAQGKAAQTSGTVDVSIYGTGSASGPMGPTTATGGSQPHENMSPYLALNFVIALQGIFPSQN
jgi:microcystin-dependent protein